MPLWLRKTAFVIITIVTLGIITPTHLYQEKAEAVSPTVEDIDVNHNDHIDEVSEHDSTDTLEDSKWPDIAAQIDDKHELVTQLVSYSVQQADVQAFKKFGPIISDRVGEQYREEILPKIEEVIAMLSNEVEEEVLRNLVVTELPSSGISEKIFHIYDGRNGKDIVRFHVRRDHPPKQGHWFNFHYHTVFDNYENHHELGKIYWDKNTPPKWMS
ncbi:YpjP family protein [Anaerobacillus sp. MEB173]|uniref:YpjP family protein n=1 Tax=Anaerobacillus sp. MEB173 TaxID=3383345 RepID=UPI003F9246D4